MLYSYPLFLKGLHMKRLLIAFAILPCVAIASDWVYEEQSSDFQPTRLQAYLDSDSGQVVNSNEKSQASIVISVDKTEPLKYNPRVNLLLYNDYAATCYKYCNLLLNIDGLVQEPLEATSLSKSSYKISNSPEFIRKIENAKSVKIGVKSAIGDMLHFEFKPQSSLDNDKLPTK